MMIFLSKLYLQIMDSDSSSTGNNFEDLHSQSNSENDHERDTGKKEKASFLPRSKEKKRKLVPQASAQRSKAWLHFKKSKTLTDKAKCNHCGKLISCHSVLHGTSGMSKHLKRCVEFNKKVIDDQQLVFGKEPTGDEGEGSNAVSRGWSQAGCREALVKMVVMDELPFSFVENVGFRYYNSVAVPRFDVPSRKTITRDAIDLFGLEKGLLKNLISGQRVSLTTDIWTSIHNNSYMVVTAHFIDSHWHLHRRILSFTPILNHKGDTIEKQLEDCLLDWNIDKVFCVTVDNASANDVALSHLKKRLKSRREDSLVLNGEYMHVRCCAHILNLIVTDGLKDLNDSVISIRNAIKYVRSSGSRLQAFKYYVEREKIEYKGSVVLDVSTRWNSTYLMLTTTLKFQKAFDLMADDDHLYGSYFLEEENGKRRQRPPVSSDWENAEHFMLFLQSFYEATLKFSASLSVTSHTISMRFT